MTGANDSGLSEARFASLAEAYGADLARWPISEREAAQRLVSSSKTAERLLAQARELDLALACVILPHVSAALESRLMDDFDRAQRRWSLRKAVHAAADFVWPGAPLWQPATVFGLALAFGIAVAILVPLDLRSSEDGSPNVFALDSAPDSDAGQDI
jgi:hypothetical protein